MYSGLNVRPKVESGNGNAVAGTRRPFPLFPERDGISVDTQGEACSRGTCPATFPGGNLQMTKPLFLRVYRALLGTLSLAALTAALTVAFPISAQADATIAPSPIAGPPGLPDGRVYEQVSPANKHGSAAAPPVGLEPPTMVAEPGGDGVAYSVDAAAFGETKSGSQSFIVAKHVGQGWANDGATPRSFGEQCLLCDRAESIGFSADLTRVFYRAQAEFVTGAPRDAALLYEPGNGSTTWLNPPPFSGPRAFETAGFSADMSTFYFSASSGGLYEWHEGVLSIAGILPDGSVDPNALPAGLPLLHESVPPTSITPADLRNQVSADGTHAFFVSSLGGTGAPEVYVRERAANGTESTALVSRDMLLAPLNGLPAPAPDGALELEFPSEFVTGGEGSGGEGPSEPKSGYTYASPDGSRVFFASGDRLTSTAPGGGGMYEFDTATDVLTYLPDVGAAPILVSSQDGSRFIFSSATGLSLWSENEAGGTVTAIGPFAIDGEARAAADGSVFAFETSAPIAGFNNGGSHLATNGTGPYPNQEIYRYDVSAGSLSCVSCPPAGVVPSGNAYLSHDVPNTATAPAGEVLIRSSGLSLDGSRVFFDTPDPLVPQDTNTAPLQSTAEGEVESGRDVYEWENGQVFLISSGTSSRDSYVGDESADGDDVFFSTAQGLSPGDTDEGYDVYDARVPRPGDRPPAAAAPCAGDVCQGPPSVPVLLGAPASATFSGLGNATAEPAVTPAAKPKVKAKPTKCKKGFVKKKAKCIKAKTKKKAKKSSNNRRGN
jgi:hypothetical protein